MDPQSNGVIYEFTLPKAGSKQTSGGVNVPILGNIGGTSAPTDIKVRVRQGGDIEFVEVMPDGREERVTPTKEELDYVQTMLAQRQKEKSAGASADESVSAPPTQPNIVTRKPSGEIASTPNPNYQKPETVTRPAPVYDASGNPVPGGTETVTTGQASYDLQRQAAQRQEQAALAQQAASAEAAAEARARLAIEQQRLTADQAYRQYQQDIDKIRLEVEKQNQAITMRGQDLSAETARRGQDLQAQTSREGNQVTLRGQDVSAGVSQRGQDLSYQQGLVGDTVSMANTIQAGSVPAWQAAQMNAATQGKWGSNIPGMPADAPGPLFGTDPSAFVLRAAQAAQQQTPKPYVLPGMDQYRLPSA